MGKLRMGLKIEIYEKMKTVLHPHEDTELFVYDAGWSDAKLAGDFGVHQSSVIHIRTEAFGQLQKPKKRTLEDTERELAEVTLKFNKLIDTLSLNKVVDVRHLKV